VSKTMAVVSLVLEEMGIPVHRTKLVKLVYLADVLFYEHFGETITDLGYMWDDFGPNAISNAIVKETDKLVKQDYACMKVGRSIYGSENYMYNSGPKKLKNGDKLLSPLERQVIRDTVERYRHYSIQQIVAASKRTNPFKTARQYEILRMNQSPEYTRLVEAITSDSQLMEEIKEAIRPGAESEGMRLQEVKQRYDL
jgi:uncharacterized phage-associated protein